MSFYCYINWTHKYAKIHRNICSFCNSGNGIQRKIRGSMNGDWFGHFNSYQDAINSVKKVIVQRNI